jgi:ribulose-5-phosphate 4-epimerase/fuculose-1-phosphate aldolase
VEQSLSKLIQLSRSLGSDIRLVWKGGGNISVKTGDGDMLIKASGTELAQMNRKRGWRKVRLSKVRRLLDRLLSRRIRPAEIKKGLLDACCDTFINAPMPSIETFFHALLGRYVIHLHPMVVLPYLCSKNGPRRLKEILSPEFNFHWIAFQGLGVVTAGQIQQQVSKKKLDLSETHIFFLSNHGMIISCDCPRQAKNIVRQIVNRCDKHLPPTRPVQTVQKYKRMETAERIQSVCRHFCDGLANRITIPVKPLRTPNGLIPKKEWFNGVITPEEWTYLGGGMVWLQNSRPDVLKKIISSHFHKTGLWPIAFFVHQQGLFISDSKENLPFYQKVFAYYLGIRGQAAQLGGLKAMARKYLSGEGL